MALPTFVKEWPETSPIEWQNRGRHRLNAVIRSYNACVRRVMIHGVPDELACKEVLARIEEGKQTWADVDGGGGWAKDLAAMESQLRAILASGVA